MMNKGDTVSLDVSNALRGAGFNEVCLLHWLVWNEGKKQSLSTVTGDKINFSNTQLEKYSSGGTLEDETLVAAPTRGQVLDWLLEKGISVSVFQDDESSKPLTYEIYKIGKDGISEKCLLHHTGEYWSMGEWRDAWDRAFQRAIEFL